MTPRGRAFVNATIHPMGGPGPAANPWDEIVQAVAWHDGHIVALGSNRDVQAEAKRRDLPIEDLAGRVVLPGFVDAHTHFLHVGVKRTRPALGAATSLDEALDMTAQWLAAHPGDGPVIAEGWDESNWPGHERPTKAHLDRLTATRPLVLRRVCGHVAVANSAALPPVQARWPDARVDLDTGVLLEEPSLYLNEALPASDAALDAAIQEACRVAHALGVTTVGDYSQAPYRKALQRAAKSGQLTVRVASSIYVQQLDAEVANRFRTGQPEPGDAGAWMRDGGLKVFLDGSLGAHTAALREPYCDHGTAGASPHPHGKLNWTTEQVRAHFAKAHRAGIQVHAHAIGDAAIDQGLAEFGRLAQDSHSDAAPWAANRLRHRFEHFEIVHDEQLAQTADLHIVASSQPNFVGTWSTKGGMYEERLGDRFHLNNRFQAMKGLGIELAFGSDGMPFGPLPGLDAAVHHPDPEQRMTAGEAVWHYTNRAAWSLHWEAEVGSLAVGKRADVVVLEQTSLEAARPAKWVICDTIVDGRSRGGATTRSLQSANQP